MKINLHTQLFSLHATMKNYAKVLTAIMLLATLAACSVESEETDRDEVDITGENIGGDGDVFEKSRLLNIQIELSDNDFEQLRAEGRTLASSSRECVPEFDYTEFKARVTIDGDTIKDVMVRKKGFLGSLSPTRPSLKLDFDDIRKGQTYQHRERMTLNNNRQDISNARQCLSYHLFSEAEIAAPRCNFAKVTINGEYFGIYTHVEPIKKRFLKDHFTDKSGNLYEAQLADFGQYLSSKFEKKTNESDNDRTDLIEVDEVFALSDAEFENQISNVIDVDEFIRFWAIETLIGHWDSASGNANNFYIYHSPVDDKFHFIPWGADASFSTYHFTRPGTGPIYRNFRLAERLYQIPRFKAQFENTLTQYLEEIWNEQAILAEVDRMADLTDTSEEALETIRNFIQGNESSENPQERLSQRERLENVLLSGDIGGPPQLLVDQPLNCQPPVSTQLTATVSTLDGQDNGIFRFTLPSGEQVDASISLASLNVDSIVVKKESLTNPEVMSVLLIGADMNNNYTPYVLQVFIEEPEFIAGSHALHGFATNLILFEVDETAPFGVKTLALGAEGNIHIDNVSAADGSTNVEFTIEAELEYKSDSQ